MCTKQIYQATIPVENVTLISKLKLVTPKNATKAPTTDELGSERCIDTKDGRKTCGAVVTVM